MSKVSISHRRTHNLLLISKLLSLRDNASPLSLVLDTLEQSAKPLLQECIRRANLSKTHTVLLSFETLQPPKGIDTFIPAWQIPAAQLSTTLIKQVQAAIEGSSAKRYVIFIDSLHPLCSIRDPSFSLPMFLTTLIMPRSPTSTTQSSIMAVYHTDIPAPTLTSPYSPTSLALLTYTATTLFTVHSLSNSLAIRSAESRSLARPTFGLSEETSGILIGLPSSSSTSSKPRSSKQSQPPTPTPSSSSSGVILELEHRRKSGRTIHEDFFLPSHPPHQWTPSNPNKDSITLLDDHPLFKDPSTSPSQDPSSAGGGGGGGGGGGDDLSDLTFSLDLTERQRRDREGVVLPYFDAQKSSGQQGPGEGGRILYDMGSEDDFDEEEDEI